MYWAIVIGIDEYGGEIPSLSAAVDDAERFYDWLTSKSGGNTPEGNVRLLLGRIQDDSDRTERDRVPTKDNIMGAINDLMRESKGAGEKFYFYFSGHGLTSSYGQREETALATSGFDERHTDQSIAVRSLTEFFETTRFEDQFFFIDACRSKPRRWEFELGGWSIPRRRIPGQPPVQQFILYATSPGGTTEEVGWPGEAVGAFTDVLMSGLGGKGRAKAWSWEDNCYEVRWERLATYVKSEMEARCERLSDAGESRQTILVPQDVGSRGVFDRDRDARLATVSRRSVSALQLNLTLNANPHDEVDVVVLDAIGVPVASARRVSDVAYSFVLPPRTYSVRASRVSGQVGRLLAPVELYDEKSGSLSAEIHWHQNGAEDEDEGEGEGDGRIEIRSPDPLATADIRDDTGRVIGVATLANGCQLPQGYYRVRQLSPGQQKTGEERCIALAAGGYERVELSAGAPEEYVCSLAEAFGGHSDKGSVTPVAGATPITWAQPSTVVAAGLGAALHGDRAAQAALGVEASLDELRGNAAVAFCAVAGRSDTALVQDLRVRVWPRGESVPHESTPLKLTPAGVASSLIPLAAPDADTCWLSIESPTAPDPTVVSLPILPSRLGALVVQVDPDRLRLYQFHPLAGGNLSTTPDRMRRVEHLERLLLGGRLDGAALLAGVVAGYARDDPFAGCVAGYVLLRLGCYEGLGDLASSIVSVAPTLSDAFILRGEYEAFMKNSEASTQAFVDAANAGVPAFGEGLTRLIEGLRAYSFVHPRGALVRHLFQRHVRGVMWAAFTPRRPLEAGGLVITGADLGFEG